MDENQSQHPMIELPEEWMEVAGTIARMRVAHLASMGICQAGWAELEAGDSQADDARYMDEMDVLEGRMTVAEYNRMWCPDHIEAPHGKALS
jgi:hypothetical protein